jgi:cytochrome c-type biogenesis protein CcmF
LGPVSRYFEGESTSEVGLRTGLRRDLWTVVAPDIRSLLGIARRGDKVFTQASSLPRAERAAALGEALRRMVARYRTETAPVTFRVLVSPLVTWVWLGALIVFGGGLIALWPAPAAARRRPRAGYAARVARELGRA